MFPLGRNIHLCRLHSLGTDEMGYVTNGVAPPGARCPEVSAEFCSVFDHGLQWSLWALSSSGHSVILWLPPFILWERATWDFKACLAVLTLLMGAKAKQKAKLRMNSCPVGAAVCVGLGDLQPSRLGHCRCSSRKMSNSTFSKAGVIVCSCSEGNLVLRLFAEFKKPGALWGSCKSEALSFAGSNRDALPGKGISRERHFQRQAHEIRSAEVQKAEIFTAESSCECNREVETDFSAIFCTWGRLGGRDKAGRVGSFRAGLEMEISVLKRDNCSCLFSLQVFCDNTVGTASLWGIRKQGLSWWARAQHHGDGAGPSPGSSWKREAATGGIWLVLDDTPTPADNDLINRQPCQIRPQIAWLRARSWIRETLFDVIRAQLGYMLCSMAQAKCWQPEGEFPCPRRAGHSWHLWSPSATGGVQKGWQEGTLQSLPGFWFLSASRWENK